MSHKVIILDVAKPDFRQVRTYVKAQVGETAWEDVNLAFKAMIKNIGLNPEAGRQIDELVELGQTNFRFRLERQTKIVYESDDKEVLVHMFIQTKQDFRTHLMKRLFEV